MNQARSSKETVGFLSLNILSHKTIVSQDIVLRHFARHQCFPPNSDLKRIMTTIMMGNTLCFSHIKWKHLLFVKNNSGELKVGIDIPRKTV